MLIEEIVAHQQKVRLNTSFIGEVNPIEGPYYLVAIPDDYAGLIIGKSGETIKKILSETGVSIFIPNKLRSTYSDMIKLLKQLGENDSITFTAQNKPTFPHDEDEKYSKILKKDSFTYTKKMIIEKFNGKDYKEINTRIKKEPYRVIELSTDSCESAQYSISKFQQIIDNHEERLAPSSTAMIKSKKQNLDNGPQFSSHINILQENKNNFSAKINGSILPNNFKNFNSNNMNIRHHANQLSSLNNNIMSKSNNNIPLVHPYLNNIGLHGIPLINPQQINQFNSQINPNLYNGLQNMHLLQNLNMQQQFNNNNLNSKIIGNSYQSSVHYPKKISKNNKNYDMINYSNEFGFNAKGKR